MPNLHRLWIVAMALLACPAWGQTTQPATRPAARSAEEVLGDLLRPSRSAAQPLQPVASGTMTDRTTGPGAVAPGAATMNVLREGTYIVDRVGRLNHAADGQQWEFVFESDGRAMQDPPLVILPNLKLMEMEKAVNSLSRDLRFRVTGMLTEYRGRNYILLEKAVVVPEALQQF